MTDDTIRLITASVKMAIEPSLERIHNRIDDGLDKVHGRVTDVQREVSAMGALISQMPTLDDQSREIQAHHDKCEKRRRWWVGLLIGLPAAIGAAVALASYLH